MAKVGGKKFAHTRWSRVTAEIRLREIEASLRAAQARCAEKRREWRSLVSGASMPGEGYEAFVIASIAYASTADQEAEIADAFFEAQQEAQAEQIRRERERQPEFGITA